MRASNLNQLFLCFICLAALSACGGGSGSEPPPIPTPAAGDIDLREMVPGDGLIRLYGSDGTGSLGVPVAGGYDINGDGFLDFAMASMLASPESRSLAGQVYLALGNGQINYTMDTASSRVNMLTFIGDGASEMTGSEIWMGDVTGDGLGDLLIARQNFFASNPDRAGAGALTIIVGSANMTSLANDRDVFDLRDPPEEINVLTLVGAAELDRLGIWMRVGDMTGDGVEDIAVGADQADTQGSNSGVVYVIRGGEHLDNTLVVDLSDIANSVLSGEILRILPPEDSENFHFGATLNVADLDGNGLADLMVAATLNRGGAAVRALGAPPNSAQSRGGSPGGRLFILWDDNFPETWLPDFSITADDTAGGTITDISGTSGSSFTNHHFGEEVIGGLDYNGDTQPDLFVGDITGDAFDLSGAGLGFVFFNAAQLQGQTFNVANVPNGIDMTIIYGSERGAISNDTALHGDFDNDGIADLAVSSPHANPLDRHSAGALHVLWGQSNWPSTINLENGRQPADEIFQITNILGANGSSGNDTGDTLAYSAASGDLNGDGAIDLIVNEMVGNGLSADGVDAGNLIVISGAAVAQER